MCCFFFVPNWYKDYLVGLEEFTRVLPSAVTPWNLTPTWLRYQVKKIELLAQKDIKQISNLEHHSNGKL